MIILSPAGSSVAPEPDQILLTVTYLEKLCKPICVVSTERPQVQVNYSYEDLKIVGDTVFIRVKAVVSMLSPSCGCKAIPQVFNEYFTVSFQKQPGLPSLVDIQSVGNVSNVATVECGVAYRYSITDSLVIGIKPPTKSASTPSKEEDKKDEGGADSDCDSGQCPTDHPEQGHYK